MGQRRNWTAEEDERIVAMRHEGCECAQMAEALDRSLSSTKTRIDRLIKKGVLKSSQRHWAPWEDAKIASMRDEGASTPEIAKTLDRPLGSTWTRIHHLLEQGTIRRLSNSEAKARWRRERTQRSKQMATEASERVADIPKTADVGYVVGVLFGDGFLLQNGRTIGLKCTNSSLAQAFADALLNAFGEHPRRLERIEHEKRVGGRTYHNIHYFEVMLHRRHIASALRAWLRPTSTWAWSINVDDALSRGDEYCNGLIQGLYDSDGSVSTHGRVGVHIRLGTASEHGARSLHELMTKRGYGVGLNARVKGNEYRVDVHAGSCVRFATEISSRIDYKKERLNAFLARRAAPLSTGTFG